MRLSRTLQTLIRVVVMKRKRVESIQDIDDDKHSAQRTLRGPGVPPSQNVSDTFPEDGSDDSDYDSLFDADEDVAVLTHQFVADSSEAVRIERPALRTAPPVPGLYLNPSILIPADVAEQLWKDCMGTFFHNKDVNQVMLFERARALNSMMSGISTDEDGSGAPAVLVEIPSRGLPNFLLDLLGTLDELLKDVVPPDVHMLLFPNDDENGQARQVILNHYRPGEGITPHVDLLKRYGDGIIGVSLHSGTVMHFAKVSDKTQRIAVSTKETVVAVVESEMEKQPALADEQSGFGSGNNADEDGYPEHDFPVICPESHSAYLPERSIIVLSGEARYRWTHGIFQCTEDVVESKDEISSELIPRGERLSITFRWLLPGADIVGA